ncbi:hypothetical protein LQ939_02945 [Pantoea alhagi]|uniref:HrpJ domain-containing protein n=1 Tax=Pantoea alhagi TaxID=1891675 RepID=UPI00202B4A08|nr:HrpJ domain-containing protein [Pantoea alhagi]URQ61335.1 hypothetical protein LQ939_02945 [Pantoea alhagi]
MLKTPTLPLMPHPFKALMKAADGGTERNASRVAEQSAAVSANDMKEEVGLMFSERAESQKKTEQRRVQQQHLRHRQNAGKVELHKLYAMLDSDDRARRETHLGQLRDALKRKPPADTDELLAQLDNDPARCDLLLRVMEREARDQGDDELCHTINNHLQTLQTQHGERLRAGLNTAAAFAEFTVHPQQRQTLRNLYYDSIVHQQSAIAMVDLLLAHTETAAVCLWPAHLTAGAGRRYRRAGFFHQHRRAAPYPDRPRGSAPGKSYAGREPEAAGAHGGKNDAA